jgi:hypothetical protein
LAKQTWDDSYAKQAGYVRSLQEPGMLTECVLVAIEVPEDRRHGFALRGWRELSMALRREIARYVHAHDRDIVAAMMLGFVGAIEQNLLQFGVAAPRSARDQQPTLVSKELLDYLSATMEVRNDLCVGSYHRHEARLLGQMGLEKSECERHSLPAPEDREAEIGICRPAQRGGCRFYVYLWWSESKAGTEEVVGAVALDLSTKKLRDDIWSRFHRKNPNCRIEREVGDYYFLFLTAPIDLSTRSGAPETLDQLVSEWLGYCESVGGLKLLG